MVQHQPSTQSYKIPPILSIHCPGPPTRGEKWETTSYNKNYKGDLNLSPPPLREGGKNKTMEFPRSQEEGEKCQGRRKNKRLDMRGIFFPWQCWLFGFSPFFWFFLTLKILRRCRRSADFSSLPAKNNHIFFCADSYPIFNSGNSHVRVQKKTRF